MSRAIAIIGTVAGLGLVALAVREMMREQYVVPQFTYSELMNYLDAQGYINFAPSSKPVVNSQTESDWIGGDNLLFGAPRLNGLGDATNFDWGDWGTTYEYWEPTEYVPWEPDYIYPGYEVNQPNQTNQNTARMSVSELQAAVANHLIQKEGFRPYIYDDANGRPWSESKKKNPTIGFGHLVKKEDFARYGEGWTLTEAEAYALLIADIQKHLGPVIPYVTVPLSLNQWIPIASLAFQVGPDPVIRSRFLKAVNNQDWAKAELEFKDWNKETIIVDGVKQKVVNRGVTNRRNQEWAMFATPAMALIISDSGYA